MNYTHLGRTGLKVSRLCLGTMNFGDVTDEKTSARILDEALEAGINFIDTADVYGTEQSPDIQQGSGLSEEIIGRWLQQGGRRERIVLATKVYQPMGPGPNDRRLSAYHIRKACEDSLRRLKTDHIDVYQMHHIDRHTPWEEIWQAMELLVQQGKVLYIGSSKVRAIVKPWFRLSGQPSNKVSRSLILPRSTAPISVKNLSGKHSLPFAIVW